MLSRILGTDNDTKELQTSLLKVRGRTLIFANSVFSISNISLIEAGKIKRPLPLIAIVLILAGLFFLANSNFSIGFLVWDQRSLQIVGLILSAAGAYFAFRFFTTRRHGLRLVTNSGEVTIIVSRDEIFLKQVAVALYNIMNDDSPRNVTFDFSENKIIQASNLQSSPIVLGEIHGDIVNTV